MPLTLADIAAWPKPNYINPVTRGDGFPALITVLTALTVVVVSARVWSRLAVTRNFGVDDALILCGLLCEFGVSADIYIAFTEYGWNRHLWDVPVSEFVNLRLSGWIIEIIGLAAQGFVKSSILLFLRRIVGVSGLRWLNATIWIGIVLQMGYVLAFLLVTLLACRPIDSYWKSSDLAYTATHKFHCIHNPYGIPISAIISTVSDFYVATIPSVLVWRLQMTRGQQYALCALLSLGYVAVGAGIARTYYSFQIVWNAGDVTWYGFPLLLWIFLEGKIAIICASAPALKPIFKIYIAGPVTTLYQSKSIRSGHTGSSSNTRNNTIPQQKTQNYSLRGNPTSMAWVSKLPRSLPSYGGWRKLAKKTTPPSEIPITSDNRKGRHPYSDTKGGTSSEHELTRLSEEGVLPAVGSYKDDSIVVRNSYTVTTESSLKAERKARAEKVYDEWGKLTMYPISSDDSSSQVTREE